MKSRKPGITLIKIFIKVGFGVLLGLFVEMVYSAKAQIDPSFRLLGLCSFLVGGVFLIFGGLRLFFGSAYIKVIEDQESGELFTSLDLDFLCGFGKSGEDLIAGIIILLISLGMMIA